MAIARKPLSWLREPPQDRTTPRNLTKFGTGQTVVTVVPVQVNVVDPERIGTKLTNLGNVDVFYGNGYTNTSPSTGDLLPAGRGNWVFIPSPSVIFVCVASGTTTIAWAEVYDD